MCVTICGRFCPDEGVVAGYGNRIRAKYTTKWGVQIVGMIFQTRSNVSSLLSNLMCLLTCRIMQNSVFILCGKVFFRLYSMWIIRYYRFITYILHFISYSPEAPIPLSLLRDSFIPLFSLIPNQIQEYSEINSLYLYILSFSKNIL